MVPIKLTFLFICLSSTLLSGEGRPEAPLPYFYPEPAKTIAKVNNNNFASTSSQSFNQNSLNQAYLPTNQVRENYNLIPSDSYGVPILRGSNIATGSTRNYIPLDLVRSYQAPISAYRAQPEPQVTVQKHIYVHVAPPDADERGIQRIQQQQVVRQKHYKIIFVKVPSYPAQAQYVAQQQAVQQEKTLVYVLVRKPDDYYPPAVPATQVASSHVSKPEVYFIKYKAKSEHTSHPIVGGGGGGGQNVIQQAEGQHDDNDSVVIESAERGVTRQRQGYSYDRPLRGKVLN